MRLPSRLPVATVLAALLAAGSPAAAQRATLEKIVHQQKLENGLHVIVMENHSVPLATAELVFRGGAATQGATDQGVPHLFEHMLFKGFSRGGPRTFQDAAANIRASYNGTTSDESVTYYLTLPSGKVDDAIGLLASLVRDPRFREDDLRTERHVVFGEFHRNESDHLFLLHREVSRRLWGESFHRKNTIGDPMSLLGVTPKRLEEIYRQYYVPNNAALIVTGDVVPALVFEDARNRFASWKPAPDPFVANPVPPIAPLAKTEIAVLEGPVDHITIEIAWQGPGVRADPAATWAADVLMGVVNDPQSRFQQTLVDGGLFQSASIGYSTLEHTGPLTFRGTTTMPQLAGALTVLGVELDLMRNPTYFTAEELDAAKKRRGVQVVLQLEQGAGLAHLVGYWWSVAGLDYYFGYVDNMAERTPQDLTDFVTRYIAGKPFAMGVLTTPEDGALVNAYMKQYVEMVGQ